MSGSVVIVIKKKKQKKNRIKFFNFAFLNWQENNTIFQSDLFAIFGIKLYPEKKDLTKRNPKMVDIKKNSQCMLYKNILEF